MHSNIAICRAEQTKMDIAAPSGKHDHTSGEEKFYGQTDTLNPFLLPRKPKMLCL